MMTQAQEAPKRLVIYTVLTGDKEPLGDPLVALETTGSDIDISFICFTDNRALQSKVWQFRYIDDIPLPTEKLSRRPKALPHEYLQDWNYSLYIDNIVQFKRLPQDADLQTDGPYLFKVFKHATRTNPQQEADAIVQLGYESADRICTQLDFYAKQFPLASIAPLSTCTVILRQHMHPALIKFGTTWWEQILNFCKRDQMSFDFAIKWNRTQLKALPGLKHDNDLIQNTANIQPNRVHANFDPVKYAWLHRDEPEAQKNPRRHYLEHGRHNANGQQYEAPGEMFEYLCHLHGASLGQRVAPRRAIAPLLQSLLQGWRTRRGRMLLLRVKHAGSTAFTEQEFEPAEKVLCSFMPGMAGTRLDLETSQLESGKLAFPAGSEQFDLVLAIGLPGGLTPQLQQLVVAALNPQGGQLCCICVERAQLAELAQVEAALSAALGVAAQAAVFASAHDGLDQRIPNSLVSITWNGAN